MGTALQKTSRMNLCLLNWAATKSPSASRDSQFRQNIMQVVTKMCYKLLKTCTLDLETQFATFLAERGDTSQITLMSVRSRRSACSWFLDVPKLDCKLRETATLGVCEGDQKSTLHIKGKHKIDSLPIYSSPQCRLRLWGHFIIHITTKERIPPGANTIPCSQT